MEPFRIALPKAGEVECNDIDDDDARTHICMMVGGSVIGRVGGAGGGERTCMRVCTHAGIWTRAAVSRRVRGVAGIFSTAGEGIYEHTSRVQHAFGSFRLPDLSESTAKDTTCTKNADVRTIKKP